MSFPLSNMSVQSLLQFDLKLLNLIGIWWNSKFSWKSLMYSITVCVIFYTFFWLNLLTSKNFLTTPKPSSFVFNRLVYFRLLLSFLWHCTYAMCSLFYRKEVLAKLYNEMLELDLLLNYDQIITKNLRSRFIFKLFTIAGAFVYFILSITARLYTTEFNLPNLYYNLLIVTQFFSLFLINKYICVVIYLIYTRYEIVLNANNRFNRRHLIIVQLKLHQIVILLNESFGFIIFMEITRHFVMLVTTLFFFFEDGQKHCGNKYLLAIFLRFLNSFPQIALLCLLFHYSQKISDKVSNLVCKYNI